MSKDQPSLAYMSRFPEAIVAMQSLEHYLNAASGPERSLHETVRLRVSLLNGCDFCTGLHRQELARSNAPEGRIQALTRWRESDAFTHRQRAALQWADAVTDIQTSRASDTDYEALKQHFSAGEIVALTIATSSINSWNRLGIAFRSPWELIRSLDNKSGPANNEGTISGASPFVNSTPERRRAFDRRSDI